MGGKLVKIRIEFHEIYFILDVIIKSFHFQVCFFADDEKSNSMISIDIGEVIDIWGDIFEDKHNIISSIQINLLISLYCSFNFLFFLIFLHQLFYVDLLHIFLFKLGDSLPLILLLLIIVFLCINQSLINFDTSFIEMTIIIYFQF